MMAGAFRPAGAHFATAQLILNALSLVIVALSGLSRFSSRIFPSCSTTLTAAFCCSFHLCSLHTVLLDVYTPAILVANIGYSW